MIGVIRSVERLLRQSLRGFENHLDLECGVQGFSPKTHGSFGNRHPECSRVAARAYKRSEAIRERCAGTACKLESTRNLYIRVYQGQRGWVVKLMCKVE